MPRPSNLSSDNILRFLQVKSDPASQDEIARGLHIRRADRRPLFDMLSRLKKRRLIEELPGGRYRISSKKGEPDGGGRGSRERSGQTGRGAAPQSHDQSAARGAGSPGSAGISSRDEIKGRL